MGLSNSYKTAFEIFLYSNQKEVQFKVFEWISYHLESRGLMGKLKDEITSILSSKIIELGEISVEQTQKTLCKHFSATSLLGMLKGLGRKQDIQFHLVEKVVKSFKEEGDLACPVPLLMFYIELLCVYAPHRVPFEVSQTIVPSDLCLKLCIKHNLKEAQALLYEQTGDIQASFEIYQALFTEEVQKIVEGVLKHPNTQNSKEPVLPFKKLFS